MRRQFDRRRPSCVSKWRFSILPCQPSLVPTHYRNEISVTICYSILVHNFIFLLPLGVGVRQKIHKKLIFIHEFNNSRQCCDFPTPTHASSKMKWKRFDKQNGKGVHCTYGWLNWDHFHFHLHWFQCESFPSSPIHFRAHCVGISRAQHLMHISFEMCNAST